MIDDGATFQRFRKNKNILKTTNFSTFIAQESNRKIVAGRNVVVSTGTGSGKTNCL